MAQKISRLSSISDPEVVTQFTLFKNETKKNNVENRVSVVVAVAVAVAVAVCCLLFAVAVAVCCCVKTIAGNIIHD